MQLAAGRAVCFYERNGVVARAASSPPVWTKCLLLKDLDSIDFKDELGKKIVDNAARKLIKGYIPPIALVEDANYDQAITVIQYEETANLSNIPPHAWDPLKY